MKQKLMLLNIALLLLGGVLAWRYRLIWLEAREREARVLRQQTPLEKSGVLAPLSAYAPAIAMNYGDVVQKMLFARDRNPNIIVEPPAPVAVEPMPPLPAFFGLMTGFGDPGIILSEKPGAQQRIYRAGDRVGPFKLLQFDTTKLKLEWKDETLERRLDELLARNTAQNGAANNTQNVAAGNAPAATPPPNVITPTPQGPGTVSLGDGSFSCQANDSSPSGTVQGGLKKVAIPNPFGTSCRWVPVK